MVEGAARVREEEVGLERGPHPLESSLLAGMLGDAWGGAYEGRTGALDPIFPKVALMSDDTQLGIATCEAILEARGAVEPERVAASFARWFTDGRLTGLGSSTLKALRDLAAGGHWALSGAKGEFAAGAGAAMRAAPLAFFLDPARDGDRQTLRDVARITHHHDEAYVGALAMVLAVRQCWALGRVPSDLLACVARELPDTAVRDRMSELRALASTERAAAFGTSGHVVDAVPFAIFLAAHHGARTDDCAAAIRSAISFGGDTDTIASLTAQILGAAGVAAPRELVERVQDAALAAEVFARTARLASR